MLLTDFLYNETRIPANTRAVNANDTLVVLCSCCLKREASTTDAAEQVGVAVAAEAVQQ